MMQRFLSRVHLLLVALLLLQGCSDGQWNNPYPAEWAGQNILYRSFETRPKHLDPVASYSSNEYAILGQIYEPVLQYHYLKRPYALEALTAMRMPVAERYDAQDRLLGDDAPGEQVAYSVYTIEIKPGIQYQPHPAFARDASGTFYYHDLTEADLDGVNTLMDFEHTGSRELVADDYVYQIKRIAHPAVHSPILGVMNDYIVGLADYAKTLKTAYEALPRHADGSAYLDLTQYPLEGVRVLDRYRYQITVKGEYPQLLYWLAMPFFAPVPPEADIFYSQPGMKERNITLDWYPIGTGAYMLTENNPNRRMVLVRNPNFHEDFYPAEGSAADRAQGLLADAGQRLPFIDKVVYSLEKESIPYWNKFLQGYYDSSGIASDSFDQAITFSAGGDAQLTDELRDKGIVLQTAVAPSTYYMGFNMLDEVVGGYSEDKRKLRQAISIAIDYEEYIAIFRNGRGIPAHSPIPPGIPGYLEGEAGINAYVYRWEGSRAQRKSVAEAKRLLAEAGYPDGRDAKTGKPLLINFDVPGGGPDNKAMFDWMRKQLAKINVQLNIRDTDYNRFQEKMLKGNAQLFIWGWNADYPDPENFLFLLYGPNSKALHKGENAANYANPEFDQLFVQMKNMPNSPERLTIIRRMLDIAQRDAPWLWGYHPQAFGLYHQWFTNVTPNLIGHNTLKYQRIDPQLRDRLRSEWNRPIVWPLVLLGLLLLLSLVPAILTYRRKEHVAAVQRAREG